MRCKRCGFPFHPDDKDFAHRNCDETWVDEVNLKTMEEIDSYVAGVWKKIDAQVEEFKLKHGIEEVTPLGKSSKSRS